MVNKILIVALSLCLAITSVFAYGGSGAGMIVFNTRQVMDNNENFKVDIFNLRSISNNIVIDCKAKELLINGAKKTLRSACNFDKLELSKGSNFEIYIGANKYGIKTDTYGTPYNITIDNITYSSVTNAIELIKKEVVKPVEEITKEEPKDEVIEEETIIEEELITEEVVEEVVLEEQIEEKTILSYIGRALVYIFTLEWIWGWFL